MADEAATEAAAPAAVATPEPAAKNESLTDQMERLGWDKDEKYDAVPNSLGAKARAAAETETPPEEETTKPEVPKPKKTKDEPADPSQAKREQLEALVKDLGLVIEDGHVSVAERHQLRAERREAKAALAKLEAEAVARIDGLTKAEEEKRAKDAPRFDKLSSFEKAIDEGDHEAMAKIAGFESYDKLQEHIIALKADPAYKRLRAVEAKAEALERETREKEAAAKKSAEEETARVTAAQQQREQAETRNAYMKGLTEQMLKSTDPFVKAMADDPSFANAVFRVQQEHWDGEQTITPEQAVRTAAKGMQNPLMAELKKLYDRLHPVFAAPAAAASVATPAAKPKPRTPEPTKPPAPSKGPSGDKAWKESARRRMEEAAALDRRANGAR